jgi:hypothetical protein
MRSLLPLEVASVTRRVIADSLVTSTRRTQPSIQASWDGINIPILTQRIINEEVKVPIFNGTGEQIWPPKNSTQRRTDHKCLEDLEWAMGLEPHDS